MLILFVATISPKLQLHPCTNYQVLLKYGTIVDASRWTF